AGDVASEHEVTTLQEGPCLGEAEIGRECAKFRHRDLVVRREVDRPQQSDVNGHRRTGADPLIHVRLISLIASAGQALDSGNPGWVLGDLLRTIAPVASKGERSGSWSI